MFSKPRHHVAAVAGILFSLIPAVPSRAQYELGKLVPADLTAEDEFGRAASVSGTVAVFGAFKQDCAHGSYCGAAYVFRWNGVTWTEEQKLVPGDAQQGHYFGGATAISGDAILVGAATDNGGCGAVYVFRWNGAARRRRPLPCGRGPAHWWSPATPSSGRGCAANI